jgi:hypothetical protein
MCGEALTRVPKGLREIPIGAMTETAAQPTLGASDS